MCEPLTIAATAAAVSAGYAGIQGDAQAGALNDYQSILHDANVRNANSAALREFEGLNRRQNQERRRASDAVASISRQARLATGTAAASSESTAGNSVAALIGEFEAQAARQTSAVDFNLREVEASLQQERVAVRAREADRIASSIPRPIPGTDWLGLGIGLASDIFTMKFAFDDAAKAGTEAGTV